MIAAHPMDSSPVFRHERPRSHYFLGFAITQVATTFAVVLLLFQLPLRLNNFTYGLVYSNSIGWIAFLVMPRLGPYLGRLRAVQRWVGLLASLTAMGVVGSLLAVTILATAGVFPWSAFWHRFSGDLIPVVIISLITGVFWFLYESLNYRARFARTQARLAMIESRIQPHFLFNTLNSIAALIPENPAAAERMTEQLAALLRSSLDSTHTGTVRLDRELKLVTDYLEIQKTRFGDRINFATNVPDSLLHYLVPPFSLQTLAENCVKHGGKEIRITARNADQKLQLEVWDSGPGFTEEQIIPGHGLHNLGFRLSLLWGTGASLDVLRDNGEGSRVRITMPLVKSA